MYHVIMFDELYIMYHDIMFYNEMLSWIMLSCLMNYISCITISCYELYIMYHVIMFYEIYIMASSSFCFYSGSVSWPWEWCRGERVSPTPLGWYQIIQNAS